MREDRPIAVCRLAPASDPAAGDDAFVFDAAGAGVPHAGGAVILPAGTAQRARELLESGVPRVYIGQAALADSAVVERLAADFGRERIGVYVAAKRMHVGWGFDTVSNADFKFVTPSTCEPCWEVLDATGSRTGTHAGWWIARMLELGASSALVRADVRDDTDLNILATLVEQCGERLWVGPLEDEQPALADWIALGRARRFAVSSALYERDPTILSVRGLAPQQALA